MLIFGVGDFRTADPGISKDIQSWIMAEISMWRRGPDRTVDPGVSKHIQSWIKAEILMWRGGADRTVDPGVPKDVTFLTSSVALLL